MKSRFLGCKGWVTWSLSRMGVMIAVTILILMLFIVYTYISCVSASDSANLAAENLAGAIATVYSGPIGLETEYKLTNEVENRNYAMAVIPGGKGILINVSGTRCGKSCGGSPLNRAVIEYPSPLKNETEENVTLVIQNLEAGVRIGKKDKCAGCIKIDSFNYDGEDGCDNPDQESVTFANTCPGDCVLTAWTVKDRKDHTYTFPEYSLPLGNTVTVYTRCKLDSEPDSDSKLFWCYTPPVYICRAIWNNDGDTLYLKDLSGLIILEYTYPEAT
jgi:hypothetical protein